MREVIFTLVVMCLAVSMQAQSKYKLNIKKSTAQWQGFSAVNDYAPKGTVDFQRGNLSEIDGSYSGQVVLNTRTISYPKDKTLEKHLKNQDFFYVKKYPTATFKLKTIKNGLASGDLIIRGVTQSTSLKVSLAEDGNQLLISGKIKIDRTKHGIKYKSKSYFQDLGSYAIKDYFDLQITMVFEK